MMNWFKNTAMMDKRKEQPGTTLAVFENHWKHVFSIIEKHQQCSEYDSELCLTVTSYLNKMMSYIQESKEDSCKDFWIQNKCSETVIGWLHFLKLRGMELDPEVEVQLVQMLYSLCELASKDWELLGYLKKENELANPMLGFDGASSLASLLLEYCLSAHETNREKARQSFLFLLELSCQVEEIERSFTQETGLELTNVLISGLSACFAQLPTFSQGSSEQITTFAQQLQFVDKVTHAAPKTFVSLITHCFSSAFLETVIKPALTQDEGSRSFQTLQRQHFVTSLFEEIGIVTYYLQIICESLTHPLLIKSLVEFIIPELLPTFIQRMNHVQTSVTVSTLSLFNVLLEFYCEDIWHALILQYILPQNHLMVSQRNNQVQDIDFRESSIRFLTFVPATLVEALGPDSKKMLTEEYGQYLSNELRRWASIDAIFRSSIDHTKENLNATFPRWNLKYDGTDALIANDQIISNGKSDIGYVTLENETPNKDNSMPLSTNTEERSSEGGDEIVRSSSQPQFTNISLDPSQEDLRTPGSSSNFHARRESITTSEGYSSLETPSAAKSPSMNKGSFGPFLDTLMELLGNWTKLKPEILLMVSELFSTMASSRVPLLQSLLIDPTLILQPSYVSLASLLNRIRGDLDSLLRNLPHDFVQSTWASLNKEGEGRCSSSHPFDVSSSPQSLNEAITGNIKKMTGAIQSVFQRRNYSSFSSVGRSNTTAADTSCNEGLQSIGGYNYKFVNHAQGNNDAAKVVVMKAYFFTHWLLELAAISNCGCWKRYV